MCGGLSRFDLDRDTLDYPKPSLLEGFEFIRVVGDDPNLAQAKIKKYFGALLIVSRVDCEAQLFVGFDSVCTVILKSVCPYLVENPDTAAFLLLIHDRTAAFLLDHLHCHVKL